MFEIGKLIQKNQYLIITSNFYSQFLTFKKQIISTVM